MKFSFVSVLALLAAPSANAFAPSTFGVQRSPATSSRLSATAVETKAFSKLPATIKPVSLPV